jgi:hypothetical protein
VYGSPDGAFCNINLNSFEKISICMNNSVFSITGDKLSSFIVDGDSLKFSSQKFSTQGEFLEAWGRKLSLANKVEIKFDSIKLIKKEDNDKDILVKYKTWASIPSEIEFAFDLEEDNETFFNYLQKERYFSRTYESLTAFKAIRGYAVGLIFTIAVTVFCYYQAIELENGTASGPTSGKARIFNLIVGTIGDKGVIIVGGLIVSFLLYKVWSRFSNPPHQTKLLPPNS